MLFGPVFNAEMVTGARRMRHLVTRLAYGAVLFAALGMVYAETYRPWQTRPHSVQHYAELTYMFFRTYAILQLLGVLLVAPALTAGVIASERERRTIEYLFATDLSNWEIVMGKLVASLLRSIALLLVGPPILALAMWMGGVGPDRLAIVLVVTLSTLVASTSLALSVSVWSPRARQAFTRVYFYLLVLLIVPPFIYGLSGGNFSLLPSSIQSLIQFLFDLNELVLAANPFYVLMVALDSQANAYDIAWSWLLPMLGYHLALSVMCVGSALYWVRRAHLRSAAKGAVQTRHVRKRRGPERWPMLWKELFTESIANKAGVIGKIVLWLVGIGAVGATAYAFIDSSFGYNDWFWAYTATFGTILACVTILFVATRAAVTIATERERDTWPLLMSTPLEPSEIVLSKWAAALYSGRWLALFIALLWILCAVRRPMFLLSIPPLTASFGVLACFSAALGTWFSLWCRSSARALGSTIGVLLTLGGGYMFIGMCCINFVFAGRGSELIVLVFSPWILFLLVSPNFAPEIIEQYIRYPNSGAGDDVILGVLSYTMGVGGYAIAAGALMQMTIGRFDRFAGRLHRDRPLHHYILFSDKGGKPSPSAPVAAILVNAQALPESQDAS